MAKLSEVLKEMNDECMVQFLSDSTIQVKDKKRTKDTEITFATNEVNCDSFFRGGKQGIVVWVDADKYKQAIVKLNNKE